jgi:DNA replication protein DnaC
MNPFEEVIDRASDKAKRDGENDYIGDDGLLMCGICHTRKQVKVNFLGKEKIVYCICKCEQERVKEEERERELLKVKVNSEIFRLKAFPDSKYCDPFSEANMMNWTFNNDNGKQPELTELAKNYVENFETFKNQGKGLLFYGSVGTGKSYMAACIANAIIDKGFPVLMTTFERIEMESFGMSSGKQEYFDSLNKYPLLILDDLGTERDTDYMQEIVNSVVNKRYLTHLPLIITTNLTSQQLQNPTDIGKQRIYSRLLDMCSPIKVEGEDQRKLKAIESFAETKRLLGL